MDKSVRDQITELFPKLFSKETIKTEGPKLLERWTGIKSLKELDKLDNMAGGILLMRLQKKLNGEETTDALIPVGNLPPKPQPPLQESALVETETVNEESLLPVPVSPAGPLALAQDGVIERVIQAMAKIKAFSDAKLRAINPKKMRFFGDTVCLCGSAIDEFIAGMPLPLELKNVTELPSEKTPTGYSVFRFQGTATNTLTGMAIPVYSEESSEKGFYCTRYVNSKKTKLPPDQVNVRDVRMAAHRGLRKEMIKAFFGLRGLTREEARTIGIKVDLITKVPFGGG